MWEAVREATARRALEKTPLSMGVVRAALYSSSVLVLVALRNVVPAWDAMYWLTVAFGLTSIFLFFWAKSRGDSAPLTVSIGLDLLLLFSNIYVLSAGTALAGVPPGITELVLVLAVPVAFFHFGALMGGAVTGALAGWYFVVYTHIVRPENGTAMALLQGASAVVLGVLVTFMVLAMRQDQERREKARYPG